MLRTIAGAVTPAGLRRFSDADIGKDHWHFAPWLDLDDVSRSDQAAWLRGANKFTGMASFVQGYTSGFNQVRAWQQKTAALGFADKVFRTLKQAIDEGRPLDEATMKRFEGDFGLGQTEIAELSDLIHRGVVEFQTHNRHTFVNRLNMDQWDGEIGDIFASAMTRNINQLVQKSMAGEQDAWMHTHVGSIMMHLKTFPMQAIQKQFLRNIRYGDTQAMGVLLWGLASAAVAVLIRDAIDGREREPADLARAAFGYSNMTGWIPTIADPALTLLGLDDMRINPYGPHHEITPPSLKWLNDAVRIPGAVGDTVTGDADWHDKQAIRAIPFTGTYILSRMFE